MSDSTLQIIAYYVDLLIIQYHSKPHAQGEIRAAATAFAQTTDSVQTLTVKVQPVSGNYRLEWNGESVGNFFDFNWNATTEDIQAAIRLTDGLEGVVVTGSFADDSSGLTITVTFTGTLPVAPLFIVTQNSMIDDNSFVVDLEIAEIDEVLPLAIQNGFNLIGDDLAVGVQLDVLGKYVGVSRSGPGFTGQITLTDSDYIQFIRIAIARNNLGSSLYDIDTFIATYFPGVILVSDFTNMHMSYLIATVIGSYDLLQRLVRDKMLPKPMAVEIGLIIYAPVVTNFFGFRTYDAPASLNSPFNSYSDYHLDWPWLSYAYALIF